MSLELAQALVAARNDLRQSSRKLHDHVASSIAASALRIQLLQMDYPNASEPVRQILEVLNHAMDHVRDLSRDLDPNPVRRVGLVNALRDLAEAQQESFVGQITFRAKFDAPLPLEVAQWMYDTAAAAVESAVARAAQPKSDLRRIRIRLTGSRTVTLQIADDGSPSPRTPQDIACEFMARQAGLQYDVKTNQGTIVFIRYAMRRPSRGRP